MNSGYARVEAFGAVAKAELRLGEHAAVAELIREGLRDLAT